MRLKTKIFLVLFGTTSTAVIFLFFLMLKISYKEQITYQYDEILNKSHFLSSIVSNEKAPFSAQLYHSFKDPSWITSTVIDANENIIIPGFEKKHTKISEVISKDVINRINSSMITEGLLTDTQNKIVLAYSFVPNSDLLVISYSSLDNIFRSKYLFIIKLLSFMFIFIGVVWAFSEVLSSYLTNNINYISQIISNYGTGNFSERIKLNSQDDFGILSKQFNKMADQIQNFIDKQKKTIRMEEELKTAKRVQKYFFPEVNFESEFFNIAGYYEPATECGGDWWFYKVLDSKVYILIGDVTGHGTASAMLTSSCRTAISVIFNDPSTLSTSSIATRLNQSIYETVKGDLNMTMLILEFDFKEKKINFTNASHEFPLYWKTANMNPNKKNIESLAEVHGPRLGESANYIYKYSSLNFTEKTRWILFSDGLYDIQNTDGVALEERGFLKTLFSAKPNMTTFHFRDYINNAFQTYRKNKDLKDDISFIIFDVH